MILPFHPQSDLVDARATLRQMVDAVLDGLSSGRLPGEAERQQVDGDAMHISLPDPDSPGTSCVGETTGSGRVLAKAATIASVAEIVPARPVHTRQGDRSTFSTRSWSPR